MLLKEKAVVEDDAVVPFEHVDTDSGPSQNMNKVKNLNDNSHTMTFETGEVGCCGFLGYMVLLALITGIPVAAAIVMWSEMGYSTEVYAFFFGNTMIAYGLAAFAFFLTFLLYLLDFYWPPHLENQYLALFQGDKFVGRSFVFLAMVLLYAASLFIAEDYPTVPVTVTVIGGPILALALRFLTQGGRKPLHSGVMPAKRLTFSDRDERLRQYTGSEADARRFYAAAMTAFFLLGIGTIFGWILWALANDIDLRQIELSRSNANATAQEKLDQEVKYIGWLSPVMVGAAYLMFSFIVYLRVKMASTYDQGEVLVNVIAEEADNSEGVRPERESTYQREMIIARHLDDDDAKDAFLQMSKRQQQQFAQQHLHNLQQISNVIKITGTALLVAAGILYVCSSLVVGDSQLSALIMGFLGVGFLTFFVFIFISFRRLMSAMADWASELPLFRLLISLGENSYFRAMILCCFGPLMPIIFCMSFVNQLVRKYRRLYDRIPKDETSEQRSVPKAANGVADEMTMEDPITASPDPQADWLTERVMLQVNKMAVWNWIEIIHAVNIWCLVMILFIVFPKFLNVFLSWLNTQLNGLNFGIIIVADVAAGMVCFLLPPVPGIPVYFFTGIMVTANGEELLGFWGACGVAIITSFIMKLLACAMQQKLIGEQLGNLESIRSMVGVNKPMIRALEAVLKQKGLSMGKVAILCGGPDWPTSVLAGVLKCSLVEMELGTLPIIFFVAPCTLTGSFYLKSSDGAVWARASSLILAGTAAINIIIQLMAAWAIQNKLDEQNWELTKPLEQNVQLDWLAHKSQIVQDTAALRWSQLPGFIKFVAVASAIIEVGVAQAFYWIGSKCFGTFNVTDDIARFKLWVGGESGGLILTYGACGLAACTLGIVFWIAFNQYVKITQAATVSQKLKDLEAEEERWKENRIAEARACAGRPQTMKERCSGIVDPSVVLVAAASG